MGLEQLSSLILPSGMLDQFDVIRLKEIEGGRGEYHIWLDEKNSCPEGYESKGFYNTRIIQDFPIRGKAVYLHCRRRRWRDKEGKKPDIKSSFDFIAYGVRLTSELATFLKG